jgi:hypothetical protein
VYDTDQGIIGESPFQPTNQFRITLNRDDPATCRGYRSSDGALTGTEIEDQFAGPEVGLIDQPGSQGAGKEVRTARCRMPLGTAIAVPRTRVIMTIPVTFSRRGRFSGAVRGTTLAGRRQARRPSFRAQRSVAEWPGRPRHCRAGSS